MARGRFSATITLLVSFFVCIDLPGQTEGPPPVDVRGVGFAYVRPVGGSANWMEATVEVDVRGTPEGNPGFVDTVRVALVLGLRSNMAGESGFVFYRSEAEAPTLESGTARFRFYLPPAVVRRYQLTGEPFAFAVDLWVEGQKVAGNRLAISTNLKSAEALRSFLDRVARDAIQNDGILVPQYDTPFLIEYARDTPAFVRRNR